MLGKNSNLEKGTNLEGQRKKNSVLLETGTTGLVVRGVANRGGGVGGGNNGSLSTLCQGHFCNSSKLKLGRNYGGGGAGGGGGGGAKRQIPAN